MRATIIVTIDVPKAHIPVAASELICPGLLPIANDLNQIGINETDNMVNAELPTS